MTVDDFVKDITEHGLLFDLGQYKLEVDDDDEYTLLVVAEIFRTGGISVKKDIKKALSLGIRSAMLGHPEAQLFLGEMYSEENEIKDILKSNFWYRKAAQKYIESRKNLQTDEQTNSEPKRAEISEEIPAHINTKDTNDREQYNNPVLSRRQLEERTQIFPATRKCCATCTYWKGNRSPYSTGLQIKAELKEGTCAISLMTKNPNTGKTKTGSKRNLLAHMGTNCEDWRSWI